MHVGETVDFEVLEEVKLGNLLMIPKGGVAWATVTEAQSKRRMARGGKLDMNIDSVRLVDGEKVALRAVKEVKGGGHTGAMTGAIVGTAIVFFPAAPLFLFMHGKDITIPKGTEITAYINGNFPVDAAKFPGGATSVQLAGPAVTSVSATATATLDISSTPLNADIEVDGSFIGNTPSSFGLGSGAHTVKISKSGYKPWERKVKTSTGTVRLVAELETMPAGYVPAPATAPRTGEPDRTKPLLVNATVSAMSVPTEMTQLTIPGPLPSSTMPGDNSHEGSIGAWSDEKPGTRRDGVRISSISPAGPVEQVGIQQGDFVLAIDDHHVLTAEELSALIRQYKAEQRVRIRYRHNATIYDTDLIMGHAK